LDVVREVEQGHRTRKKRRRLVLAGVVVALLAALAGWLTIDNLGTIRFISPPKSAVSAIPQDSGDWPMYLRNPEHGAYVARDHFIPEGIVKWVFETSAPIESSPAVVDGRVYLGTGDRGIVALDAGSGELIWQYATANRVSASVAVAGDWVFASLRDGRIVALDKDTGLLAWELQTTFTLFSSPAVLDGEVIVGSGDRKVHILDAVTGKERWSYPVSDAIVSSPATNGKVIAVLAADRRVHIVDMTTGNRRIDYRTAYAGGSATISGDLVFVGDDKGLLRALDWGERELPLERAFAKLRFQGWWYGFNSLPNQKGFVWGFQEPSQQALATPVADEERVYAGSLSGSFFALDRETGEKVWEFKAREGIVIAPIVIGDTVYFGDVAGWLYGLEARSGELVWEFQTGGQVIASPAVAGDVLFLASGGGKLYGIE
jgi:outer membrane protein assembly factor BamB